MGWETAEEEESELRSDGRLKRAPPKQSELRSDGQARRPIPQHSDARGSFGLTLGGMEWFEDESLWRELYPYVFPVERVAAATGQVAQLLDLAGVTGGTVLDLCRSEERRVGKEW